MENTKVENTNMENTNINYMALLSKKTDEDYLNFFKSVNDKADTDAELSSVKQKLSDLRKQITEQEGIYNNLLGQKYSEKYDENMKTPVLAYSNRKGDTFYFDGLTGKSIIEPEESAKVITLKNKFGEISIPSGLCLELAGIVVKEFNYTINSSNSEVRLIEKREYILRLLNKNRIPDKESYDYRYNRFQLDAYTSDGLHMIKELNRYRDSIEDVINSIDVEQFFNKIFNVNKKYKLPMTTMLTAYMKNPAFETILKVAPQEIQDDLLQFTNIDKAKSIPSILGITPYLYNKAIETGTIKEMLELSKYIKTSTVFNKNDDEWIELIKKCREYEEALEFYNIDYKRAARYGEDNHGNLISAMAYYYTYPEYTFWKYYSFGKFIDYIVNETINQGYTNIWNFVGELKDYLKMCSGLDVKPNLYTSYLKIVHDIVGRNHSIKVSQEQDEVFANRYKGFKPFKYRGYSIIAPKVSKDLITEGDNQSSCVGSYIKRVLNGDCMIYFLRRTDDIDTSLVTIEVAGNIIRQTKAKNNRKPEQEHIEIIKEFAKKRELEYDPSMY